MASILGTDVIGPFSRKPGDPAGPGGWCILYQPELHWVDGAKVRAELFEAVELDLSRWWLE